MRPFDEAAGLLLDDLLKTYRTWGRHRTSCDLSTALQKARTEGASRASVLLAAAEAVQEACTFAENDELPALHSAIATLRKLHDLREHASKEPGT